MTEQENNDRNGFHEHHHGHSDRGRCRDISRNDWWEDRRIAEKILIGIGFGILGIAFVFFIGWVTMMLWNALMPDIFGFGRIRYWQAWGLLLLSCIFFKDFGNSGESRRRERKRKKAIKNCMREESRMDGDGVSNATEEPRTDDNE